MITMAISKKSVQVNTSMTADVQEMCTVASPSLFHTVVKVLPAEGKARIKVEDIVQQTYQAAIFTKLRAPK